MSLVRIAARIAAVQALRGKTLVGDNVLDSQIGALDIDADGSLRTDADKPFISVYTDAAKVEEGILLRSFTGNGRTEFLFESGVTSAHVETAENGESAIYPGVPATDASFEFLLDIVARQIGDALSDPQNEWAEIFRRFIVSFDRIERARTSGDGSGVKLAAQQIKVIANTTNDPERGVPLKDTSPMARFFAKAAEIEDPVTQAQVALMNAQITGDLASLDPGILALLQLQISGEGNEFAWQTDLRSRGLTRTEGQNMLLTTPDGAEEDIDIVVVDASPAQPTGD